MLKPPFRFASGGLLGDAFLHLIPHAIMAQEGGHGHSHGDHGGGGHQHGHSHGADGEEGHSHDLTVGLGVLAGILAFLTVEKVVRINSGGHAHSHSHAPSTSPKKASSSAKDPPNEGAKGDAKKSKKKKKEKDSDAEEEKGEEESREVDKKDKKGESQGSPEKADTAGSEKEIRVTGYLNLVADFFHNFTDGLAIGASFLAGKKLF